MKRKRNSWDVVLLFVLCAIGIVLGRFQTVARSQNRLDPISSITRRIVSPVSGPLGVLATSGNDFVAGLVASRRLIAENRRLKALAAAAELYDEQLDRLNGEIARLRTLQTFGPIPGKRRLPADVIGYSAYENRITLNVGSAQGVTPNAPVEAPEGLVGTVQVVEAHSCQVLLLASREEIIGALDLSRNPPLAGLIRGDNSPTLSLTFQDPKAAVEVGDHVVTSGFSEHIPRGIKIGKVISVSTDEEFGSLRAKVDPAVSVGLLREVHVLL